MIKQAWRFNLNKATDPKTSRFDPQKIHFFKVAADTGPTADPNELL